jgi:acetyl-CoA C-acetyltransferase
MSGKCACAASLTFDGEREVSMTRVDGELKPDDIVILGGVRSPFSKFGGALRGETSVDLAAFAIRQVLARTGPPVDEVDEVYLGISMPSEYAFDGSIPARVAMLRAGLRDDVRSLTVDRACCSSMTAAHLGAASLAMGMSDLVVAAGTENMSRTSFIVSGDMRWGHKRGVITMKDPLAEPGADIGGVPVAVDVGNVALEHGVGRDEQDLWAVGSHIRYRKAFLDGFFDEEIAPYEYGEPSGGRKTLHGDEGPRPEPSLEKLSALPTVLGSETVTAGNAPGLDAGAAALLMTRRSKAEDWGIEPLATVRAVHSIARHPRDLASAPAPATAGVLAKAGWGLDDIDVFEINEAFAAVPLVSARLLADGDTGLEASILERMNVNGGAVAIGHPTGASGARLMLTAARQLRRVGGGRASVAICGGLGQADAVALSVP